MTMSDLDRLRALVIAHFPDLADARFTLLPPGFHSLAVDADDRLVFKFPKDDAAARALRLEAALLAVIRPAVTMAVPDLRLIDGPPLFSCHAKIGGSHLLAADYDRLGDDARAALAADLARFYAELHALDHAAMRTAGAGPARVWPRGEEILRDAWPVLAAGLRPRAERAIAAWDGLGPDPHGDTYGFFDGHGWNMAFDHAAGRLNGIYDFADSGFGPLHRDFVYSNFIAWDLTDRLVAAYEALTGRTLDRARIHLLTGVYWLAELGELANDPQYLPMAQRNVAAWAAHQV